MQNAVRHGEGDLLQFAGQVDPHDTDTAGDTKGHGGEVHNSANPRLDQLVGHALGMGSGHGNHSQLDLPVSNNFRQAIQLANLDILDVRADLFGIGFESRDDAEPLLHETTVTQEGPAQVSDPHQ